ncbi:MAG: A/G-specific adenine glycosylase [Gloeomargarita sp. SKYG98]|nr:A/G-specific adenine glycosylase [Gloeomargarita sp. SKYG98]
MDVCWYRQQLLRWYVHHGRALPWRDNPTPYRVLVSEFMLQQTQVNTVIPYYQRWMATLPTLADCAQAQRQDILKLWEGLGYYRRAEYLHQTCQVILRDYGGQVPQDFAALVQLPGIGRTTAGGILSHAFNLPYPICDGNVQRVLSRLFALEIPPRRNQKQLWTLATQLLDPENPRDFNQALMDLGATVCLPQKPQCLQCPWQPRCQAFHTQQQEVLPMREAGKPIPHRTIGVAVIWNDQGQVLIDQRPPTGLLANLWEFPGGKVEPGETVEACIRREIQEELGLDIEVGPHLVTVEHAYTHLRVTLVVHHCRYGGGTPQLRACQAIAWVYPHELERYPFPQANRRIIHVLQSYCQP